MSGTLETSELVAELVALDDDEWVGANGRAARVVLVIRKLLLGMARVNTVAVVDALLARFPDEDEDGVVAQAVASLREYRDQEGGRTSSDGYAAWHGRQVRPHPHPSLAVVRGAIGGPEKSWEICKVVAYGDPAYDPTTKRLRKEPPTTPADCEAAGRLWLAQRVADGDRRPLRLLEFLAFCRRVAVEDDRPVSRLPLSEHPLRRHFGGWFGFLLRIGAVVDDAVDGPDAGGAQLDDPDRWERQNMVLAVRAYAADCDGPLTRNEFFGFFRDRCGDGDRGSGSADYRVQKYFGTFRGLLMCAGLELRQHDPGGVIGAPDWEAGNHSTGVLHTDEQLLAFVDAAAREHHGDLTPAQFRAFLARRARQAERAGRRLKQPSLETIRERLGGIPAALVRLGYITELQAEQRSVRVYPPERLEEALIAAMLKYTTRCTTSQYRAFAASARADGWRIPATESPIVDGLGEANFADAKRRVIADHPDIQWPAEPVPECRTEGAARD